METYDYIVVGAGSAGGTAAARLSQDPAVTVMLLEAGRDHPSEAEMPSDLLDSRSLPGMAHDWNYTAVPTPGRTMAYRRGKVVGGTSAINAAGAMWPRPADFAEWVALGNDAWSWRDVEPWLRRVEADADASDASVHGRDGPIPIRRYQESELIPLQRAFSEACRHALGMAAVPDHNDVRIAGGIGPWPMNRRADGARVSTALAYLSPARDRQNLVIRGEAPVARLVLEAGRAVGVELAAGGDVLKARGGVVLCAGAFGTPAILMRSGIGPADELTAHGITPVLDRPGVGARLWDHASVPVRLVPKPGQCDPRRDPRFQMLARVETASSAPLVLVLVSFLDITPFPALVAEAGSTPVVALISAALMRPRGHGRLRLIDADPLSAPRIELGFCQDAEDVRGLREGTRLAWRVARSRAIASEIVRVAGLDEGIVGSDTRLDDYVRANVGTFNHACGTAPMGPEGDPLAVADQRGRVRGVDGLWIADASLMPYGVSVPPNLTAILIGERVADWVRKDSAPRPEDGGGWLATVPDLPGCMSDGGTREEAARNVGGAIDAWIEEARALGRAVPAPSRHLASAQG